ncbi:Na/Pi cotransporter family protein [Limobrevibacterium gyesilva]|uniref:Na/Pi cotransporter family protein n=1 Tax=Limobrevibacterium gyesilva TaxID=2991712 RepID=A0AA41YNP6_9PROT|nr:Na/Pi cotransporter family protein [Limobrevibacterium gyesilva]MCW3477269.1 Na/Pi cotransporter family protein [Limobrevibacterium gyesilva]
MSVTRLLVELIGHVVLLLWGARMVQTGIVRAFGSDLRRLLGKGLSNRLVALLSGMVVTALLQSSTATALMVTSFAAGGLVALVPALAVMLGANVGTALIVKALTFDVAWISPILLIAGYAAFKRGGAGGHRGGTKNSRVQNIGRVCMGLGLMLLALRLLVESMQPAEAAPLLRQLLGVLTGEPLLDVILAAALTFAAHSSVAVVLMIVPLAATGVVTPVAAFALVLGANLGSTIPPVLAAGSDPAARRLPLGNLAFRALGCLVALPLLHPLADLFARLTPYPGAQAVDFHIGFNLVLAVALVGLLDPAAKLLTRLLPAAATPDDPARPRYLNEAALDTPYLALSNAARETLRMGDLIEAMLRRFLEGITANDRGAIDDVVRLGKARDRLEDAVRTYMARISAEDMTERDAVRRQEILDFVVNLGHAGGIVERSLTELARRKAKRQVSFTAEDRADLAAFHANVLEDLRLALSTFMAEDPRGARQLLDAKRRLSELERTATRAHLARLEPSRPDALEGSSLHLAALRDLKRINSHLSAIGYAVLEQGPDPAHAGPEPDMADPAPGRDDG